MLESSLRQCRQYVQGELLDVGCGRRPYEKTYFANASHYVGMDYLSDRSCPDVVGSATDIPFPENSFDTVVSTEVLEHVPDPAKAIREMFRVVRPGGYVILTTPMYWPRHEVPFDFFRYPYDGLLALFEQAGFTVERMFNRGRSYAFIGQVIQQVQPVPWCFFSWLVNQFFLWCDRHLRNDVHTLGWTVVARKPGNQGGEIGVVRAVTPANT